MNIFQWKFNQNAVIFIEENAHENVVCEMASILSRPQCVNLRIPMCFLWLSPEALKTYKKWNFEYTQQILLTLNVPIRKIAIICKLLPHVHILHIVQKQSKNWVKSWNVWKIVSFKSEVKIFIHHREVEWKNGGTWTNDNDKHKFDHIVDQICQNSDRWITIV